MKIAATNNDKKTLRKLAIEVKRISENPINDHKIRAWKQHNSLRSNIPMVFVHPDGAWEEIIPQGMLVCQGRVTRELEYDLRKRIFRHEWIRDDVPITAEVEVHKVIHNTMWGIPPKREGGGYQKAFHHVPVIKEPRDWSMLSHPVVTYDEKETEKDYDLILDAIGDILPVSLIGIKNFSFHLLHWYCDYRGINNLYTDLYDCPETVKDVMRYFVEGIKSMLRQYEKQNLLSLNNDGTFFYTGGLGYTDDLPAQRFDSGKVRLLDLWAAAEAQEFSEVSADMHEEFVLPFERELLMPFGMTGYGCCDDLSKKLKNVLKIKNLRRIAVCPWADIANFTPILKRDYIMTWKPKPMSLAMELFDGTTVEHELKNGLEKAKGGIIELVLRDTHTCRNQPERFGIWVQAARKAIAETWE